MGANTLHASRSVTHSRSSHEGEVRGLIAKIAIAVVGYDAALGLAAVSAEVTGADVVIVLVAVIFLIGVVTASVALLRQR